MDGFTTDLLRSADVSVAAELINGRNGRNGLTRPIGPGFIADRLDQYIGRYHHDTLIGVVRVARQQWYQSEVMHICVRREYERQGHGFALLQAALNRARHDQGTFIAQCTIRKDNEASLALFGRAGFAPVALFTNMRTSHVITVLQCRLWC